MQKKLISLFLSALILISCFSVGFIAFAEEAQDAAVETAVDAAQTDDATQMLEMYLTLAQQEDEMTKTQRDKFEAVKAYLNDSFTTLTSEETITQVKKMLADVTDTAATALKGGPVGAFEESVNAYEGKVNTANPSEEDLAGYEALVTAYNKLSDAQKGEIEIMTFDKFLHLVLDREYYVERAKYEKAPASKVLYGNAYTNTVALLGKAGYVADFDAAAELATVLANSKATAQEKLDAFAAANANTRAYSAVWYASYGTFYYKLDASYIKTSVEKIMDAFGKELDASDKFTETAPEKPKKPTKPSKYDKKYPQGENDPAYIKDMAEYTDVLLPAYLEKQEPYAKWEARKNNHSIQHKMEGLDKLAAAASEYAPIAKMMKDALAAVEAFEESSANIAPAKKVVADFEKMTPYQQAFTKNNSINVRSVASMNSSGDNWSTSSQSASKMYTQCVDIAQYDKLTAFIAVIDSITEPYRNEDIVRAKDAYNEVPSGLQASIPAEILAKYKAILASIAPDTPSLEKPDLSVFKKTVVTYPENATKEQVATALPRIQNLLCDVLLPLLGMEGGLTEVVENGLYTNATVTELCKFLFPTLAGLVKIDGFPSIATSFVKIKPSKLAGALNEPEDAGKYAGAIAKLTAAEAAGQKAYDEYVKNGGEADDVQLYTMYWTADFTAANGDWGFQDGDREGFLDAVSAVFRAVSIITMLLTFENNISTTNGTYTYNAYEDLVPIFEALDLRGYMSSHEYTLYVQAAKDQNSKLAMDARIRPILVPIFNLIDDFAAAPLDTLLDVLPKLAYALESGVLNTQVGTLISKLGFGLGDSLKLDLTTEGIFDLVAPMLQNIVVKEAVTETEIDKNGDEIEKVIEPAVTISITLDKAKFLQMMTDMAGCGEAAVKESKARGTAYRLGINSDKPDAFVVLFRWLYGEITTAENMRAIKTAINATDINLAGKMAIKVLLNRAAETSTDDALVTLVNLAAPKAPEIKLPDSVEDLIPGRDQDKDDGGNNGGDSKPNTEAPSVPKTGGSIATSMFSVVAVAALAGGAILLKKKQQDEE